VSDGDCFYRYAGLGSCEGDVLYRDRFGNSFCKFHWKVARWKLQTPKPTWPDNEQKLNPNRRKAVKLIRNTGFNDLDTGIQNLEPEVGYISKQLNHLYLKSIKKN
jgi:hypothetical protein